MRILFLSLTVITLTILTACSSGEEKGMQMQEKMNDGVRPASQGMMSAAYFTLITDHAENDTLIAVESTVAGDVQIHESFINEEGLSSMKESGPIPLSRGDSLVFERGGLHIMLMDLQQDLEPGDTVRLDLIYSSGSKHTSVLTVFEDRQ